MRAIALTGFMGCGKSSVGSVLQTSFQVSNGSTWTASLKRHKRNNPRTVPGRGETAFRKMEAEALDTIFMINHDLTGTMSFTWWRHSHPSRLRSLLRQHARCIYLRASIETLVTNLRPEAASRPMLQGGSSLRARIETLLEQREPLYESIAELIIDIDGKSSEGIAREIRDLLR